MLRCGDVLIVVVGGCESRGVKKCVAGGSWCFGKGERWLLFLPMKSHSLAAAEESQLR
jgi:hypothetical protein